MPYNPQGWTPTSIQRFIGNRATGASVVIVDTDCGEGYLKGLGNEAGPHALACELIGSLAADWIGLPTLDFAIINVSEIDELRLAKGGLVQPGPAFISKRAIGFPWGGDPETLTKLSNLSDITKLVIFDTWVRNCDRYSVDGDRVRQNRDNVFLSDTTKKTLRVIAMDHTHAFTCGRDLSSKINSINIVRDNSRYGLFPEFEAHWDLASASDTLKRLGEFSEGTATRFMNFIPSAWHVEANTRTAWSGFLAGRAHWLASQNASDWLSDREPSGS